MFQRNIKDRVLEALSDTPVVVLHGARQTGKSTLVQTLIRDGYPAQYLTLDDLTVLGAARRDPVGFLAGLGEHVALDEVQRAPELILAIKAAVDRDRRPGRFLLTGSAHVLNLPRLSDSLAGRVEILTLWPLSQGEIRNVKEGFIDALFADNLPTMGSTYGAEDTVTATFHTFNELMLAAGYPEAISRSGSERRHAWYDSYLSTILQRDVRDLSNIAGLSEMPRLLRIIAARAGGLLNCADLARDAGLNHVTLKRYLVLLDAVFLTHSVPPWFTNRIKRLTKSSKLYMGDTGLLAHLLDLRPERQSYNPQASGMLAENFVAVELMKQRTWNRTRCQILHFRDYTGHEVDFVLEGAGGGPIVGVEVKVAASVGSGDFRGLRILANSLGSQFHRGVILYGGDTIVPFGENLHAVPISALWRMGAASTR